VCVPADIRYHLISRYIPLYSHSPANLYLHPMASANAAVLRKGVPAAACIVLVVLLSMGPPATADIQEQCRAACHPPCNDFVSEACNIIARNNLILNLKLVKKSFLPKCKELVSPVCVPTCVRFCVGFSMLPTTTGAPTPAPASAAVPLLPCNKP
jgi:hypothetical protein